MLEISHSITIPSSELEVSYIRSQGAGGQNVNKVATAVHLRFDIPASSLPPIYKERLLAQSDHRLTNEGVVVIKAQDTRSQEKNRELALERLKEFIQKGSQVPKKRKRRRRSKGENERRLEGKSKRSEKKEQRRRIDPL